MRFWTLALALLFLVNLGWAEKLEEQKKLEEVKEKLEESKEKLKQTKQQQQEVLGKLVIITHELRRAHRQLLQAKEKIQKNEAKIGQLTQEINQTENRLNQKSKILRNRINEAYKSGGISYLELFFASRSISDFLNRMYFFEKVVAQDAQLIEAIKEDLKEVKTKRRELSDRTHEIKELAQVIEEQKKKAAEQAEEKKRLLEVLKEREKEYRNKIAELERSSWELEILIQKKMAERAKAGLTAHGSGVLIWPLQGRITSPFGAIRRWGGGYRHTGIDIAAPYGSPIAAADHGEVIFAGWWDGYGKAVVIDHGRGRSTVYAHLSRIYVQVGNVVAKGQTIGLAGSTGYSTGPHLHFEVRINGVPVNPIRFLP
jgi:murein DD-endopeptidase MepM/ murein hydrolase activator NlpD